MPTLTITKTGETIPVDGVDLQFQLTPGTEAPAEMNVYIPQLRTLFLAENANATLHNLLPPRGALVRDGKAWAAYLEEALILFGDKVDFLALAHTWPRIGNGNVRQFISDQSDLYKFMHDQTIRLANEGLKSEEIAESLKLPDGIGKKWYNRGYYGSLSFNIKAIYQRYLGWYDANPASLNPLPPAEAGRRYVNAIGGAAAVLKQGAAAMQQGDYRWAAELLDHLVASQPENAEAREKLASAYTQLAYQSENAPWRMIYLMGAAELRNGVQGRNLFESKAGLINPLPSEMIFDLLSVRVDPEKTGKEPLGLRLTFPERNEDFVLTIRNGVLRNAKYEGQKVDATVRIPRNQFVKAIFENQPNLLADSGTDGNHQVVEKFANIFVRPNPLFNIVTPSPKQP